MLTNIVVQCNIIVLYHALYIIKLYGIMKNEEKKVNRNKTLSD